MPITNSGRSGIAWRIAGYGGSVGQMAIGSGTTAFANTQTGLVAEEDRNAFVGSADVSELNKVTYVGYWSATDVTGTQISEVGVFDHAASGAMWSRDTWNAFTKDNTVELEINVTWEVF